jgi:hypothetical protein
MIDWESEIAKSQAAFKAKHPHTEYVAFNIGAVCLDGHFDVDELRVILAEQERIETLEKAEAADNQGDAQVVEPGWPVLSLDADGVRREMLGNPKYDQTEVAKLLARLDPEEKD